MPKVWGRLSVVTLAACAPDVALLEESADAEEILEASFAVYAEAQSLVDEGEVVTDWSTGPPKSTPFQLSFARGRGLAFTSGPEVDPEASGASGPAEAARRYVLIDDGRRLVAAVEGEKRALEYESLRTAFYYSAGRNVLGAEILSSLLLPDSPDRPRAWRNLFDISLALPSARSDSHEIHATSGDGQALTFFIGKSDYLLYEWREHTERPALRAEEDVLPELLPRMTEAARRRFADYVPQADPSYSVDRTVLFHPRLEAELSDAAFDTTALPAATQLEAPPQPPPRTGARVGITLAGSTLGWKIGELSPGPALRAGARRGDLILKVDGVDVTQYGLPTAAALIRGEAGSVVVLTLQREEERLDLSLRREELVVVDR